MGRRLIVLYLTLAAGFCAFAGVVIDEQWVKAVMWVCVGINIANLISAIGRD